MDGIIYTISASLGFAFMENIIYVMGGRTYNCRFKRGYGSANACFYVWNYGILYWKSKISINKSEEKRLIRKGFIIAILLHGTYDFLIMLFKVFPEITVILLGFIIIELFYTGKHLNSLIKEAKREDMESKRI